MPYLKSLIACIFAITFPFESALADAKIQLEPLVNLSKTLSHKPAMDCPSTRDGICFTKTETTHRFIVKTNHCPNMRNGVCLRDSSRNPSSIAKTSTVSCPDIRKGICLGNTDTNSYTAMTRVLNNNCPTTRNGICFETSSSRTHFIAKFSNCPNSRNGICFNNDTNRKPSSVKGSEPDSLTATLKGSSR